MDSYMISRQANPKESYKHSAKVTFIALWLYLQPLYAAIDYFIFCTIDLVDPMATFRCRKCRILLFSVRELESHTFSTDQVNQVSSDLASFDKCSSWFLKDEDILPWIAESVEEVGLREEYLD